MKGKKGSHISVIISFSLFIGFLVFLYFIIEPSINGRKNGTLSDSLKNNLIKATESEMNITTIKIKESVALSQPCTTLRNIKGTVEGVNLMIKGEDSIPLAYSFSVNDLNINNPNRKKFFKIYGSMEFPASSASFSSCDTLNPGDYSVGITKSGNYSFESEITEQINMYNNDYESFKESLGLFGNNEFSFIFTDSIGQTHNAGDQAPQKDVYSEKINILYIDSEANMLPGVITLKIW